MRDRRRGLAGLAALGAVLALVASAYVGGGAARAAATPTPSATPTPTPTVKPVHTSTTFTIGVVQDVDSTNPFTGISAAAYEIYQLQYDFLMGYAEKDYSVVPRLATSWTPSADGKTWTYKVRPGVKWSDGVPFTAADVAYTFNRILKGTYEQTNYSSYTANITSVTATDPTTVVFKIKTPSPIMYHLDVYILPEHIWSKISEKAVADYTNDPTSGHPIVGTGPFMLTQVVKGQFVRMDKNPYYWGPPTHIDHLVFRVFNNQDSMAQALKRGEIDFADNLDPGVFNALKGQPNITTVDAAYGGFNEIGINSGAALTDGTPIGNGHPALKDVIVRQAINLAINRQEIVNKVFGGYATVASTIIPSLYADQHWDPGANALNYNVAKANSMLDAAGYKKGSDGIRRMPDGSDPLVFRLYGRSSSETSTRTVQYVAGYLKAIGIKANVKIVSEDALTEFIGQGTFDLFEWGWVDVPDPTYQLNVLTCGNRSYKDSGTIYAGLSDSFYCTKEYDALNAQQAAELNPAKRIVIEKKMQELVYEAAGYAETAYYDDLQAYRSDRWTNFKPQPPAGPDPKNPADKAGVLIYQNGTYSYSSIIPLSADNAPEGPSVAQAGGVVGGIALLWAFGFGVTRLRRPPQDEVE
jgi:peptide/nickel transport system substrate-binding protein